MAYKTINPYTNEVEKEFPNATDEELEAVLAKAHQLYLDWRNDSESLEDRKAILHWITDNKVWCKYTCNLVEWEIPWFNRYQNSS